MEFQDFYYIGLYSYESGISLNSTRSEEGYTTLNSRYFTWQELGIDESLIPDVFSSVGALSGSICHDRGYQQTSDRYNRYPLTGNLSFLRFSKSNNRISINIDLVWDNSNGFNNTSDNTFSLYGNVLIPKIRN